MNPPDPYSAPEATSSSEGTATSKAKRVAGKALGTAKEKVSTVASDRKEAAAGRIGGYSDRLRAAAESADQEDPNIAHFARQAADRLQGMADYVREADFGRLRQDAANIAHRHPALFMGGMLVAGLVLGNLAKASVQTLREDGGDYRDGQDEPFTGNGADGLVTDEATEASGESLGAISDSFDPAPREDEPRF